MAFAKCNSKSERFTYITNRMQIYTIVDIVSTIVDKVYVPENLVISQPHNV